MKQYKFEVCVLGEMYKEVPEVFDRARRVLKEEIINFGFVECKNDYYDILCSSHVAVSTAKHEFFGVSMLEACYCGCIPLVPNRLVYPEIYPKECLYTDNAELYKKLENLCLSPASACKAWKTVDMDLTKFSDEKLLPQYLKIVQSK